MVLGLIGFRNRDQWEPGKQFRAEDRCQIGRSWIIAKEDHVASESFAEDADKWYYLVDCRGLDDLDQKLAHLDQDIADSEQAIEESRHATVESREQTEASREALEVFNRIYGSFDSDDWLYAITDAHGMLLWGISRKDGSVFQAKGIPEDVKKWMDSLIKLEEIEHASYLYAITDSAGNVCWAINRDGSVYQPKGMPEEIKKILSETVRLNIIESDDYAYVITDDDDNVMFAIDHKGHIMVNGMKGVVNVESFKSNEYIYAVTDSAGNLLFGVRSDGTFTTSKFELPKDLAEQIAGLVGQNFISEDPKDEEFIYKVVDAEGNILFGIFYSGTMYAPKGMPEEARRRFEQNEERMASIEEDLDYVKKHGKDWSDEAELWLPKPRVCARVDITGEVPTSKYVSKPAVLTYNDIDGNAFTKNILWNIQGNISAGFDKKNFSIDLLNADGGEFAVQFGDWVPQDSFHLKAHYSDFWKTRALLVYRHAEMISRFRPYYNRRPWDRLFGAAMQSTADALKGGVGEVEQDMRDGAMGRPDGFPFMLYVNGLPYGIYTWNIKKHKDNYHITKNDEEGKQLFFGDYMQGVFQRLNYDYWTIRNWDLPALAAGEDSIMLPSYTSSSGATIVMKAAGQEGMTLTVTNSTKTYSYPVYFNGQPVTAENSWEAGDCVKFLRSGTSDAYYFNATVVAKKWQEGVAYAKNDDVYDEETFSFEVNGQASQATIRRLFRLTGPSNNTTFAGYEYDEEGYICQTVYYTDELSGDQMTRRGSRLNTSYNTMRPSYICWKHTEVRNPKTTVCRYFTGNDPDTGNPTYKYEYYDYDSPSDYNGGKNPHEYTHEIIHRDMISQKDLTKLFATGAEKEFSKKEYNRSVNTRDALDEYSRVIPLLQSTLPAANLFDWGYLTAAYTGEAEDATAENFQTVYDGLSQEVKNAIQRACKKQIFTEHHDVDYCIDYFIVYNDTDLLDSITHNTLYTMYDGKKVVANLYDTDIALGMNSTYTNAFPAVYASVRNAGKTTFVGWLYDFYVDEIKHRWKVYRDAGVISVEAFAKLVYDLTDGISVENYKKELKLWTQSGYRKPVYWRMPAGSMTQIRNKSGEFKSWGYDESINGYANMPAALKALYDADPASVEYDPDKSYVTTGDADQMYCVVTDGDTVHWFQCTANCKGKHPIDDEAYTCGSPTSGGVFDSPKRTVKWFEQRIAYLDTLWAYEPAEDAGADSGIPASVIDDIING